MDEAESAAAALAIIQKWQWTKRGFDYGQFIEPPVDEVVNTLAFEGHTDPAGAVLRLLCDGDLTATGSYSWRTFRNGYFSKSGHDSIAVIRWRALQDALAIPRGKDGRLPRTKFELLDDGGFDNDAEHPIAEWEWAGNRFSTAQSSNQKLLFETGYAEEQFSAWNIKMYCPSAESDFVESDAPSPVEDDGAPVHPSVPMIGHSGGRPSSYDWERAVAAIVFQWVDEGSWRPATIADVKNRLAQWLADQGQHPSDSSLKERARWLFHDFRQRDEGGNNLAA